MAYDCSACDEYNRLSRRQFMAVSAAVGAGMAIASPAWLPRVSLARHYRSSQRDVMIAIYLRGGFDGLAAVVPYEDAYLTARPNIGIPRHDHPTRPVSERCIFLDSPSNGVSFGLNPNMAGLMTPYNDGRLLFVHASGSTDTTRSHFDAQKVMEVGQPNNPNAYTGWLGRHLASVAPMVPGALLRGVGIASGLQRALVGAPQTLPVPSVSSFGLEGSSGTRTARQAVYDTMYSAHSDPLKTIGLDTIATINLLTSVNAGAYVPTLPASIAYPANSFGTALRHTAALLKAQVGVEAVAIDLGGWDTHINQGAVTIDGGGPTTMANLLQTLSNALQAFYVDMQASPTVTYTLATMSEFGRRFAENANAGVDHGWGDLMILMGQQIAGGRVLANWPGLGPGQLFQGLDLAVTIDYRDVLAEVVQSRLGNADLSYVFPNYTPVHRGVLQA